MWLSASPGTAWEGLLGGTSRLCTPTAHRAVFAITALTFSFWFIPQWSEQIPLCSSLLLWLLQQQAPGLL